MKRVQGLIDTGRTADAAVDHLDNERGSHSMPTFHAALQQQGPRRVKKGAVAVLPIPAPPTPSTESATLGPVPVSPATPDECAAVANDPPTVGAGVC